MQFHYSPACLSSQFNAALALSLDRSAHRKGEDSFGCIGFAPIDTGAVAASCDLNSPLRAPHAGKPKESSLNSLVPSWGQEQVPVMLSRLTVARCNVADL